MASMTVRLQKFLAEAGVASRRKAESFIAAGRVAVNGQIVTTPGVKVTEQDTVTLDGNSILPARANERVYIMLHKPEGVITTLSDPQGRPVVTDLLPDLGTRVFPVGRLDYDSSGLLIMTNDGALAQMLSHPRHALPKVYAVRLRGVPDAAAIRAFKEGLLIEGRRTAPCGFRIMHRDRNRARYPHKHTHQHDSPKNAAVTAAPAIGVPTLAHVTLHEGRNRQIRKMCEAIGHPVLSLKRIAIGPVKLGDLPRGAWRFLTAAEVKGLQQQK